MAGQVFWKEIATVVLQNDNGASTASGVGAIIATNLDNRSGGNGQESYFGNFELKSGFAVAPAVAAPVDFYLIPYVDGINLADATTNTPPGLYYVGSFLIALSQTGVQRMALLGVPLQPLKYELIIVNQAVQTMSANWGLRFTPAQDQYT